MESFQIINQFNKQRLFFKEKETFDINYRKDALLELRKNILKKQKKIVAALDEDLGKPSHESFVTEISSIISEIDFLVKNLKKWARPIKVKTPLFLRPGSSYIQNEPYGQVLIISPWNYPFQLAMAPLVGAICAGNTVILKPSEKTPRTSLIIKQIISQSFSEQECLVIDGGVPETQALLNLDFDYIFFTGGSRIGKIVMGAAAKNLTPVTLELGGKSPCVISGDVDLEKAVKRIVWGKFLNSGQTCVAPDYCLVDQKYKEDFIEYFEIYVRKFFSKKIKSSNSYGRMIDKENFNRMKSLLIGQEILFEGEHDEEELFFHPTLVEGKKESKLMEDEIFGPILPVFFVDSFEESLHFIKSRKEKPLAAYLFSLEKRIQDIFKREVSSGSICINDVILQISNKHLPFGGVGQSGMGSYHGYYGFKTFSHQKSILKRSFLFDWSLRYPPYLGKSFLMKKIMSLFG